MKKTLLYSAAICGLVAISSPAYAQIEAKVGGHFKGYVAYIDQDEDVDTDGDMQNEDARSVDILRETELHFSGETTLENGLTVGVHFETEADGGDSLDVEESYAYFSGAWGRVNFGSEDGAAYLLQVAAPSADSNYDGIRQFVQPLNYDLTSVAAFSTGGEAPFNFDYDQDIFGKNNKLTYLTPVLNGFQAGLSYTPEDTAATTSRSLTGVNIDDVEDDFGQGYEAAGRYEGQFNNVGVVLGAGYSFAEREEEATGANVDDQQAWNVGLDVDFGPFGLGVIYAEDNLGFDNNGDEEKFVVGTDYTTGPFKVGVSYLNQDNELNAPTGGVLTGDLETDRYTGGVVYTYGPGMTFRGSVSYIEHEVPNTDDIEATSVLLGTQINF